MARKSSKSVSVKPENKSEIQKSLDNVQNDAIKDAASEIFGGAVAEAGFSQGHLSAGGGWLKKAA